MVEHPFQLLPPVAWRGILEWSHPDTAFRLLHVYPTLDSEFHKHKQRWYFPMVLPTLCEWDPGYLEGVDLLRMRAVCKDWKAAVHGYLDAQPFQPKLHDDNYLLRRELLAGYRLLTHHFDSRNGCRGLGWIAGQRLSPQIYRSVSMRIQLEDGEQLQGTFYPHAATFLRHVGPHVWSLIVEVWSSEDKVSHYEEEWNEIWSKLLGLLPNLKELAIFGTFPFGEKGAVGCNNFPNGLQALELKTLGQGRERERVTEALLAKADLFRLHLLGISFDSLTSFPTHTQYLNLTHLELFHIGPQTSGTVKQLLRSDLNSPQLTSLVLRMARGMAGSYYYYHHHPHSNSSYWEMESCFFIEQDVFCWLARFKSLRSLELSSERGLSSPLHNTTEATEEGITQTHTAQPSPFTPLSFLSIKHNENLRYEFLRRLPNLRYLYILVPAEPDGDYAEEENTKEQTEKKDEKDVEIKDGRCMRYCMYDYDWIWECNQKLSRIIVEEEEELDGDADNLKVFDRFTFERLKARKT